MMMVIARIGRFVVAFGKDTSGVILPYVAVMLTVLMGFVTLALDAGRYVSLSTQMQEVADALALAGARELNQQSGSRARATSAIGAMVSNGLTGLGYTGTISAATPVYYKNLPVASSGFTGTAATSDYDAKFVAVTVNPAPIARLFQLYGTSTMSATGQAIAGFTSQAACGISPVFICNPYETSGMTDTQATQALLAALDPNDPSYNAATVRKMFRMTATNTSPGHFGWVQPADKCNNTPCLNQWIGYTSASALQRSCFDQSPGITMATGNKPVAAAFNDRFDIYSGNGPSADYSPSINVRKGYVAGSGNNWCKSGAGDYLTAQGGAPATTLSLAPVPATGTVTLTTTKNSTTATLSSTTGVVAGMSVASGGVLGNSTLGISAGTTVQSVVNTTSITLSQKPSKGASSGVSFVWLTTPLPLDKQWAGICDSGTCLQGNGDWDCAHYWSINHTGSPPSGCTSSNPTMSRYGMYSYENAQASDSPTSAPIKDYSGYPTGTSSNGETGTPYCAINGGFTPTWNAKFDPRIVYVAVINCDAQTALGNISGGNSGGPVPVARFAKFFLTQPYNSDGLGYLYGELIGLVQTLDRTIYNQVQLYR